MRLRLELSVLLIFTLALVMAPAALGSDAADESAAAPEATPAAEPAEAEPTAMPVAGDPGDANCTYQDLHGQFEVTVPCVQLSDHSNNSQPHKRLWLAGPVGQLQIMEVPEPFRGAKLDFVMENLGRFWTARHTPVPVAATEVAGLDARVVTERKMRTTSRTWVFSFRGRNLTARGVAYGKRSDREERLEQLSLMFTSGFRDLNHQM